MPDAPATVVLPRRPVWAAMAREFRLLSPQLLPGQDPGVSWEVRKDLYIIQCTVKRG